MSLLDTHILGTLLLTDKIHFMFIREKYKGISVGDVNLFLKRATLNGNLKGQLLKEQIL